MLKRFVAALRWLASRKLACIIAFTLAPLAVRLALLPWIGIPKPAIQDEFSYLLAGDTFALGRLTNPPHPHWVFFESVHIIQQPTYMSKYPPLTGMILAFGERFLGHPWIGVLLSMSLLCGLLAWALQGWLTPLWAFLGTWLAVLKIGMLSYWGESYWGGAGAAIGGTLLIGSLPRLTRRPKFSTGLLAALGIALLALSRPFEGLLLTILCLGYLCWHFLRYTTGRPTLVKTFARSMVAPIALVMITAGGWMLFYNYRVTGDAFLLPYVAHERQYATDSALWWDKPRPVPTYRHEALKMEWVDWDVPRKRWQREHFLYAHEKSFESIVGFYWGFPLLLLILAALPTLATSRRTKPAVWLGVLFAAGLCSELELIPHYAAPATALAYIASAGALRALYYRYRAGRGWATVALAVVVLTALFTIDLLKPEHRFLYDKQAFIARRDGVLHKLTQAPGQQLVFVDYGKGHDINQEWVYNRADIDRSRIVWAREMGPARDQELIDYYPDRQVWKLVDHGDAGVDLSELPHSQRAKR